MKQKLPIKDENGNFCFLLREKKLNDAGKLIENLLLTNVKRGMSFLYAILSNKKEKIKIRSNF